jgi:hypothetical protein
MNSLKSNSFQTYHAEEEVFDAIQDSKRVESETKHEPAMEQEGQGEIIKEEEKSVVEEDTEPPEENARPRATKKIPMELRKLHTFYNPTIEGMANSDHAEFIFLSSSLK